MEEANELIERKDYDEMEILEKRAGKIINKLADKIAQTEEINSTMVRRLGRLDSGRKTFDPHIYRLFKKSRNYREIKARNDDLERESEQRETEFEEKRQQQHERRMAEFRARQDEQERRLWEEKLEAELHMTQEGMEMEKSVRETTAKLPKLKITPFNGTSTDWVRFKNIFLTQVPITDVEKFGYLLEMVSQKDRDKIANLKPGEV